MFLSHFFLGCCCGQGMSALRPDALATREETRLDWPRRFRCGTLAPDMKLQRKGLKRAVRVLAVCLLIFIMLRWFEHSQVYHPDRVLVATGAELGRPFENIFFR